MFKKMLLVFTAVIALTTWSFAKPGTWGKETPKDENQAKVPAAVMRSWLKDFSAAYGQRDGEKMDELIKKFESDRQEFPAAPRLDKWIANVKQAYDDQDVHKMGRLLDNAQRVRERIRERLIENRNERRGEATEEFQPEGRPMRGIEGQSEERMARRARGFDQQPLNEQDNFGPARRQGFRRRAGMPEDRFFERQNSQQQPFDAQRPMQRQRGLQRRFMPEQQPGYSPMQQRQQQRFGRPDFERNSLPYEEYSRPNLTPGLQGREGRRFDRPMRNEFDQQYYDDEDSRRPMRQRNRDLRENFWD